VKSTTAQLRSARWLTENGPRELESLFRAIVFHPSAPILIADDEGRYQEASIGASKLLGLPRHEIIGRSLDDFAVPGANQVISPRWQAFLEEGEQAGALQLLGPDGTPRDVEYTAKGNLLPVRHLLLLRDKTKPAEAGQDLSRKPLPSWVQDYALFLLDADGKIVDWYGGAKRIYGFDGGETVGRQLSVLYPGEDALGKLQEQLKKALVEGHIGDEGW
jgi:formate hydrogenlyase transcriptional activator